MRLFFAALAFALILTCASANAQTLAWFSSGTIHIRMGESMLVKTYVKNPDPQFANISVWLGGDYPRGLANFSSQPGVYFTPDMRNATVPLNPKEEKVLNLVVISTGPKDGGYTITLNSNTTASGKTGYASIKVFMDYAPSFPGLESWGILLIIAVSSLLMGRRYVYYEQTK